MDDADIGFYMRCLNHAWINGGVPADPRERARVLHTRLDIANRRWERVGKCFETSTSLPNQLVNPRQESERESCLQKSLKATESINRRWKPDTNVSETNGVRNTRAYDSDSDSAFDSNKTSLRVENFALFLEVCTIAEMQGSEIDIKAARSEWDRLDLTQQLAACQGIKDRVAAGELADPGFRPLPQNYLKNKTWQRTIREKHEPAMDKQKAHRNEVVGLMKIIGGLKT